MPTEIVFSSGASVKVMATVQEVSDALRGDGEVLDTARFAGFRGDDAVGGERVLVSVGAVAYAKALTGP